MEFKNLELQELEVHIGLGGFLIFEGDEFCCAFVAAKKEVCVIGLKVLPT